jgi:hypothetical protein
MALRGLVPDHLPQGIDLVDGDEPANGGRNGGPDQGGGGKHAFSNIF